MVRKVVTIASIVVLILSTLGVSGVLAGEGQTSTSILVQNLSTSDANLRVDFYNTEGTNTGYKAVTGLCGECSTTFDQRYSSGDPGTDPFQGGAIVESSELIAAVVQEMRSGGSGGVNSYEAYNGIAEAAQEVSAPLILRGIVSAGKTWNTFMSIQNTSLSAPANVTVTFTPAGLGSADVETGTINPGGTWYLRQVDQGDLGSQFFGSAKIESSQDVAVVVNNATSDGSGLVVYPTYTQGSTEVYLPGAMKNIVSVGDNYFTSLTIVAMSGSPTVEVAYQAKEGTVGAPYSIGVSTVETIDQRYDTNITSSTFFGAVKLTATGGTIAAMLNWRADSVATGQMSFATTYSGFPSGVSTAFTPYLLKHISSAGYDWSTSILIQNLDPGSGDLTVNITYNEDPNFGTATYSSSATISEFDWVDLRYDPNITQGTFFGGAKLESVGGHPFGAVVVVRGSFSRGDALSSYLAASP